MNNQETLKKTLQLANLILRKLTPRQVKRIDEMLTEVGDYGEVRIIVQRGELRYINKVESYELRDKEDKE